MSNTIPRLDFHMHTHYLGCANGTMKIPDMIGTCEKLGVTALGITDHLNSLDKIERHLPIISDIRALETPLAVYFGVELNFMSADGDFAFSAEIKERYGFQFAIGGIHGVYTDTYDLKKIIDIQHRHHLATCRNPLVDVLVHPYWFGKYDFDHNQWPWIDSMRPVPESYARELGQTAKETGTAIEINACANLVNPSHSERYVEEYIAFLAVIAETGAMFSVGSDAHDIGQLASVRSAWGVAEKLGLSDDRIWMPPGKPMVGPA